MRDFKDIKNHMLLSVIIPSYKGVDKARNMLEQLHLQSLPKELFEVVLVNDSGTPEMEQVYEDMVKASTSPSITLLHRKRETNEHSGAGAPRNFGAMHAKGTHFIFLDDDILFGSDFLENYYELIAKHQNSVICGYITPLPPVNTFQEFLTKSSTYFGFAGLRHGQQIEFSYLFTANCSVPKKVFETHKFTEFASYGYDDLVFAYTLHQDGVSFVFNKKSVAVHNDNVQFSQLLSRKYRAAMLVPTIVKNYPELRQKLHFNPLIKYFPFRSLPSAEKLKSFGDSLDIFIRFTRMYFIYRFVLAFSFVSGISSALARK